MNSHLCWFNEKKNQRIFFVLFSSRNNKMRKISPQFWPSTNDSKQNGFTWFFFFKTWTSYKYDSWVFVMNIKCGKKITTFFILHHFITHQFPKLSLQYILICWREHSRITIISKYLMKIYKRKASKVMCQFSPTIERKKKKTGSCNSRSRTTSSSSLTLKN